VSIAGQWDFEAKNLAATIGKPLEYLDGPDGLTKTGTEFGTTTDLGISDIDGVPANVMKVPGDLKREIGYIMRHGIAPNGGGTLVNQYTLIMDIYVDTSGPGAARCFRSILRPTMGTAICSGREATLVRATAATTAQARSPLDPGTVSRPPTMKRLPRRLLPSTSTASSRTIGQRCKG
jgi:hypothetical protein